MLTGKFDNAIRVFDKAEEIWKIDGNFYGISILDLMKGLIHFEIGEFGSSRNYYKKYGSSLFHVGRLKLNFPAIR